ncbi:hypothetical protein EC957_012146 [Mortierella hygrophila]|uniref:Uncharacterized protein n=1 Tax=Mortierella hygrophila TaxID=979708 RepID=A0A9P6EVN1_9FUNG|nr:hypothetical protein EC957_012146 [Mortierella hygrophila]
MQPVHAALNNDPDHPTTPFPAQTEVIGNKPPWKKGRKCLWIFVILTIIVAGIVFTKWLNHYSNKFTKWLNPYSNKFTKWLNPYSNKFTKWLNPYSNKFAKWLTPSSFNSTA